MTLNNTHSVLAVIPARYASSRFPGKPLAMIGSKPMIQHVWEQVQQVSTIQRAIIATDDERILEAVQAFGGEAWMTAEHHASGTDRMWEVAQQLPEYDIIVNVQGDEPKVNPSDIERAIQGLKDHPVANITTLVYPIDPSDVETLHNPNVVKAVVSRTGQALYFSRTPVPYVRDEHTETPPQYWHHLGLYAYRREALARFTQLPPSPLEQLEKLEQLRALEAGMVLYAFPAQHRALGIDTQEDLVLLQNTFQSA